MLFDFFGSQDPLVLFEVSVIIMGSGSSGASNSMYWYLGYALSIKYWLEMDVMGGKGTQVITQIQSKL